MHNANNKNYTKYKLNKLFKIQTIQTKYKLHNLSYGVPKYCSVVLLT